MKDFLGNDIKVGDFVAYPGAGNKNAEYGLLLKKVINISSTHVEVEGLDMDYNSNPFTVERKKSRITNTNKLVVVQIPAYMLVLFNRAEDYPKEIGQWIHGITDFDTIFNHAGK